MSGEAGPAGGRTARALAELQARAGRELEPGPWLEVTQAMVDAFAALTGDDQYIHVDPQRAAGTMFGGTVAHGYLTLGLLPRLTPARDALLAGLGGRMRVNYGLNRVRFPAPVPVGRRIRARTVLLAAEAVPAPAGGAGHLGLHGGGGGGRAPGDGGRGADPDLLLSRRRAGGA